MRPRVRDARLRPTACTSTAALSCCCRTPARNSESCARLHLERGEPTRTDRRVRDDRRLRHLRAASATSPHLPRPSLDAVAAIRMCRVGWDGASSPSRRGGGLSSRSGRGGADRVRLHLRRRRPKAWRVGRTKPPRSSQRRSALRRTRWPSRATRRCATEACGFCGHRKWARCWRRRHPMPSLPPVQSALTVETTRPSRDHAGRSPSHRPRILKPWTTTPTSRCPGRSSRTSSRLNGRGFVTYARRGLRGDGDFSGGPGVAGGDGGGVVGGVRVPGPRRDGLRPAG